MRVEGEVKELWRYPVKSMQGERCEVLAVESRGVAGDRQFAVQDANGRLGSGKNTSRFRKIDGLISFEACFSSGVPRIRFPTGAVMSGDDPGIHDALSVALGQPVRLVRESAVSHLDAEAIHLVSTGSLDWLGTVAPEGVADARRFRPNIVVAAADHQAELGWSGKRIRLGEAELQISFPTERCAMVTFAQNGLVRAPQILRHLTRENETLFGVYAQVLKPGWVRVGDVVVEVGSEAG